MAVNRKGTHVYVHIFYERSNINIDQIQMENVTRTDIRTK